jgi:malate dehydrogenase (oxaloacetate-decarboxylating)(NADP+)
VGAAILNGLKVVGKDIKNVKLGHLRRRARRHWPAWAAVKLGMPRKNIFVTDLAAWSTPAARS